MFGGVSPEHDVSILTGLQVIEAIDASLFEVSPIYIDQNGEWWNGEELLDRKNYHCSEKIKKRLNKIQLDVGRSFKDRPFFSLQKKTIFSKNKKIFFDVAFLALHGASGESGQIQGVFEAAGIPYTGPSSSTASIWMNKSLSKKLLEKSKVKVLPEVLLKKTERENLSKMGDILKNSGLSFPLCVKPCNLGSSICVFKAKDEVELCTSVLEIFKIDEEVLIEPFVENLVEYNVAVTKSLSGKVELSVIESPGKNDDVLSFKDKYLFQGGVDNKLSVSLYEGIASACRDFNPKLTSDQKKFIEEAARKLFLMTGGTGAPRIDFLSDEKSKEIWFNEINPIPGSLGYYLWEARRERVGFTQLVTSLIDEAFSERKKISESHVDLGSFNALIFPNR